LEPEVALDFEKTPANERIALWMGPTATGALGVTDVGEPLAAELNNTGGTSGMIEATPTVSWNDFGFGTQSSEVQNEPSLADASSYEEFGPSNYGGSMSHYYPRSYDDASNTISLVYDLVDTPGVLLDVAMRIDGDTDATTVATDGDFVFVYRVEGDSEQNPFTPGESKRYTKNYLQKSDFAHCVVVGDHAALATIPSATDTPAPAAVGRYRAALGGRDVTNYVEWSSDDADVILMYPGGVYQVTGSATDTATVTATDPVTGDTDTIAVTVTAP
jgi:hypothetical protein